MANPEATIFVANSIKDPSFFEFGELYSTYSDKIPHFLNTVLKYFITGSSYDDFIGFLNREQNKKAFEENLGSDSMEILQKKMKITLFCAFLDSDVFLNGLHEISYALLKDKCGSLYLDGTEENEGQRIEKLEAFIFECLCAGVLNGKLMQKHSKLFVQSVMQREFTKKHWERLSKLLSTWREKIGTLVKENQ